MPKLSGRSVVITGASSGIGRATALAFAREGAWVTLAARRGSALAAVAQECERVGGRAQYVETDVTDALLMRALAQSAVKRFGRIDVWVNNAGVGAVGRFTEVPVEAHDQVIRVNLGGYLHGAHAVLPYFLASHRGVLINVVSFGAFVAPPFGASYAASKFGLRGMSEGLRAELQDEPGIRVCDVFPGVVDTPGVSHAANYSGHRLHALAPDRPEEVADAIVRVALRPRDKISVGATAKLAPIGYAIAPGLGRWMMNRMMGTALSRAPKQAVDSGAVFRPGDSGGISEHFSLSKVVGLSALGVLAAASAVVAMSQRSR